MCLFPYCVVKGKTGTYPSLHDFWINSLTKPSGTSRRNKDGALKASESPLLIFVKPLDSFPLCIWYSDTQTNRERFRLDCLWYEKKEYTVLAQTQASLPSTRLKSRKPEVTCQRNEQKSGTREAEGSGLLTVMNNPTVIQGGEKSMVSPQGIGLSHHSVM